MCPPAGDIAGESGWGGSVSSTGGILHSEAFVSALESETDTVQKQ